jgi:hypothetical protein
VPARQQGRGHRARCDPGHRALDREDSLADRGRTRPNPPGSGPGWVGLWGVPTQPGSKNVSTRVRVEVGRAKKKRRVDGGAIFTAGELFCDWFIIAPPFFFRIENDRGIAMCSCQ